MAKKQGDFKEFLEARENKDARRFLWLPIWLIILVTIGTLVFNYFLPKTYF
jgi:hypothetical protein